MIDPKLTRSARAATRPSTRADGRKVRRVEREGHGRHAVGAGLVRTLGSWMVAGLVAASVAGCVTVNAPNKPIVIELNINIKQEVVYRLAADAGKTIDNNKDIF